MDRQRIDKWLWHARVVRTRSAAAALADGGRVRVNGMRIEAASRMVRCDDVVTVALDRIRILKVIGFAERRGPASETARHQAADQRPTAGYSSAETIREWLAEPGAISCASGTLGLGTAPIVTVRVMCE